MNTADVISVIGALIAASGGVTAATLANKAKVRFEKLQRSLDIVGKICEERVNHYEELWRMIDSVSSAHWQKAKGSLEMSHVRDMLRKVDDWYVNHGYHLDPYTREMLISFRHHCRLASMTHKDRLQWESDGKELWKAKTQLRMCIARCLWSPAVGEYEGFRKNLFSKRRLLKRVDKDLVQIQGEMRASGQLEPKAS